MYRGLSRAHFLSPTGQCKPFDAAADGYCRAEGVATVVLKRLSDAVAEGDRVYGVIRGTGINQCGEAKSITHPHAETQAALMRSVLRAARTGPRSIGVVEAHGTGTQAGDAVEMASIGAVFGPGTVGSGQQVQQPLYVSSLKGNIGHLEAASGVAGLVKLLLMMSTKQIPPQASFSTLNPKLPTSPPGRQVTIPTRITEWETKRTAPRRALLNSFGASGSNAALVLEEFTQSNAQRSPREKDEVKDTRSHHVLNLSAKTARALETARQSLVSYLTEHPSVGLRDLCYTANARRQEYPDHRLSVVVSDRNQVIDQLQQLSQPSLEGKRPGQPHKKKTVFVFSGQGGVRPGMGAELLATVPVFKRVVDECDETLAAHGFPTVAAFLADSEPQSSSDTTEKGDGGQVLVSQCACFVLEYALAVVWKDWGVSPDVVIGHR